MEVLKGGAIAATSRGTTEKVVALVMENTPSRGRVLDAPAGPGAISDLLAAQGCVVTAFELNEAVFRGTGASLVCGDMNAPLPFDDGSFKYVVCIDGIEHLENPYALIREFHRVLVASGQLIITTPNISAFRSRARYLLTGFHNKAKKPLTEERPSLAHHISLMSFPELRYALHRFGFTITKITTNRVKWAALPSILLYPIAVLTTYWPMRRERDAQQRLLNRGIYRQCLSWAVCMGETLIVLSTKRPLRIPH